MKKVTVGYNKFWFVEFGTKRNAIALCVPKFNNSPQKV